MRFQTNRSPVIAAVLMAATFVVAVHGQKAAVDERNVRAQMQFLAGDAMQGRGSGTIFERITAEYVGSQFMQFGLEPAGEAGWDRKPSFVQTVTITRNSFDGNPTLTSGSTAFEHGKDLLVMRANTSAASGSLQKLNAGQAPNAGAAVLLKLPAEGPTNLMQAMTAASTAGAAIVMVEETAQIRTGWANTASRRITYNANAVARPAILIVLSKEAAAQLSALADGTKIDFNAKLGSPEIQNTWNAIGKLTGSDRTQAAEVIVISSHLDHVGVQPNRPGDDKIFNGADDDASGTVAVMELARAIAAGKRPKRTIYFVCFGSEERGGLGSRYFADNLPFLKEKFVANLQFEMIGRPDPKVKPEELWLTGYERSNLGPELAKRGAKLVQDPHPQQNFFRRSDNYTLAVQGIIAHTVSSFGLHTDYHQPSDEVKTIDFVHMTRAISSMIEPVMWLANSNFVPTWNPGMKP